MKAVMGDPRSHATPGAAGRAARRRAARRSRSSVRPTSPRHHEATPLPAHTALGVLAGTPAVRTRLVQAAAARLAAGERPTAEAIAERAIGGIACAVGG